MAAIHLFNASRLAQEIAEERITPRQKMHYLIATWLVYLPFTYTGLIYANPPWTWISVWEAVVVVFITVVGIMKIYEAAGGDTNRDFVAEFCCLSVPVSLTTIPMVWAVYWVLWYGFRETLLGMEERLDWQFVENIVRMGSGLFEVLVFLSMVLVQALVLYRVHRLFGLITERRNT